MTRGPKPKPTCGRGHVIAVVGRYPNGSCRACNLHTDNPAPYMPDRLGRSRKATCVRGHALTPENRYIYRGKPKGCLLCRRKPGLASRVLPVPAEPLLSIVDRKGLASFCEEVGSALSIRPKSIERMLVRARTVGFTIAQADQFCVAAGRHPAEVYGSEWFGFGEGADAS